MIIRETADLRPNYPTVHIFEPKETVNLDKELPRIVKNQNFGIGTYFHVQFLSNRGEEAKLLASGEFVVIEWSESRHISNPDSYQPIASDVHNIKAEQIGNWFYPNGLRELEGEPVKIIADGLVRTVKWNPGKKVHEVKVGDKVLFASADKVKAEKFRDAA